MKRINYITKYFYEIEQGNINVSKSIYSTYKYLVKKIDNPDKYEYSQKCADHVIEFCEKYCKQSKGEYSGKPLELMLWEKAMLSAIFGFIDKEGNRQFREALLIVAKKNGKSLLASAIGLYMQVADNEGGAEVYAVATKKDQAKIVWGEAKKMVKKSPVLRKRITPLVSELRSDFNEGVFKPLASDSDSLDGLNVHCVVMDEIHQWRSGKALYNIMVDGMQARTQPLCLITSTAGVVREDIYDDRYEYAKKVIDGYKDENGYKDERFISFIYEIDNKGEWLKDDCWVKANPALGIFKSIDTLREKVNKAKSNIGERRNILCKEFNYRETDDSAWLDFDTVNNEETYDLNKVGNTYAVGGADLSSTSDLTCATLLWRKNKKLYVRQMYWIPRDIAEEKENSDKVPYHLWKEKGYVRFSEGARINYTDVTNWFNEMREKYKIYPLWVGYDNWGTQYWINEMKNNGYVMEEVIQGAKTMSQPSKIMAADLKDHLINYDNNPITKWCLTNARIEVDKNENIRVVKGRNQKMRVDGTMSLIDSYVSYQRHLEDFINMTD